ncbi:MAG: GGDEF domain-containing protein [Candidatus Hydrothermia bacterium]
MAYNYFLDTMRFKDDNLECKFLENYNLKSVNQVRIALALGAFLYAIFALLDAVIVGPLKSYIWKIRFIFVMPIIILAFVLTFTNFGKKYLQEMVSFVVIVGGAGILWMLAVISPPSLYLYSQGLMLVLIFNFTFFRLRFNYSLLNGIVILTAFQIVSRVINPLPMAVFINNNFFLWSAAVTGAVASYIMEKLERNNFLSNILMKRMAETDGLTGVANRSSFMNIFELHLKSLGSTISSAAFCMLDLDNFKEINDFYGHPKGDELLREFGKVLAHKFRATDTVGRIGGDEFGILLLDISDYQRIVSALLSAKKDFTEIQQEMEPKVTFSVGCVIIQNHSEDVSDYMFYYSLADLALSKAKQNKDSICIVGPDKKMLYYQKLS